MKEKKIKKKLRMVSRAAISHQAFDREYRALCFRALVSEGLDAKKASETVKTIKLEEKR